MDTILDPTNIRILNLLQQNARLQVKEISMLVHKSENPVHQRIRRLQDEGFIQRYAALLDRRKVGRPTLMVTLVKLNRHNGSIWPDFAAYINTLEEVQSCLQLSGEFDFLLQVSLREPQEYEIFLNTKLCILPIVEKLQSSLVLREHKIQGALPLSLDR
jgi:Lrp/AsnC family leucine-responsive transcriptional regulator